MECSAGDQCCPLLEGLELQWLFDNQPHNNHFSSTFCCL